MSTQTNVPHYTIKEAATLSGLPESTLRYYETIGLIGPIGRDQSSKHRVYSEDDVNLIIGVACLNATGMSIPDMRAYFENNQKGLPAADDQIKLLTAQGKRLADEAKYLKLRQRYIQIKVRYWQAVAAHNDALATEIITEGLALAKQLKATKKGE
jgi:DNA-binding transcriptional MerR regulator